MLFLREQHILEMLFKAKSSLIISRLWIFWQMSSHQRMWCKLIFFNKEYKDKRPLACKEANPDLPYCQIMGKWQVPIFWYSSIPLYDHMNEKCPSLAPDFYRPSDC